jgi:hypothetical protein
LQLPAFPIRGGSKMKKLQWIFCIVLVIIGVSSFDQKVSATTLPLCQYE